MNKRTTKSAIGMLVAGLLAVALAACGSSSSSSLSGVQGPAGQSLTGGKKGGTLTVLDHQDFQHLDPGQAYFAVDYPVIFATQRPLYAFMPNSANAVVPDLASGPAQISPDGMTVTVQIRSGVRFSPPVNREVTSADVAYAIERGANPNVGNGYFMPYFGALAGADKATGGPFPGVTTPDKSTIVFHLTKPTATLLAGALALPLSAPVPPEFAKKLDAQKPTKYGEFLVSSGPYMVKADSKGHVVGVGYQPGKSLTLVRNPNWSASTDYRPAYLDQINVNIGGDTTVIGRQVLTGSHLVQNDPPGQSIIKLAVQHYPKQLIDTPGAGVLWISLNNHSGPFANENVRKAVYAAIDRAALVKAGGGKAAGDPGTHFIYPGTDGFQEAGGAAGPQLDFNKSLNGDMAVAAKYLKLAGYPSGKYTGGKTLTVVGSTGSPNDAYAREVNQTLRTLGFNTKLTLVDQPVMYGKYCGVPAREIDVCPDVGWIRDFSDPQTALDVPFNGTAITPTNNSNWGQVNDPTINQEMAAAKLVVGQQARAKAWAKIDQDLVSKAVAVPFEFSKQPELESRDVAGVTQVWNEGSWDYDYTSLK